MDRPLKSPADRQQGGEQSIEIVGLLYFHLTREHQNQIVPNETMELH